MTDTTDYICPFCAGRNADYVPCADHSEPGHGYACTRSVGHDDLHVACGITLHVIEAWASPKEHQT